MTKRNAELYYHDDDTDNRRNVKRGQRQHWDDADVSDGQLSNYISDKQLADLIPVSQEQELPGEDDDAIYQALIAEYHLDNALEQYDPTGKAVELYTGDRADDVESRVIDTQPEVSAPRVMSPAEDRINRRRISKQRATKVAAKIQPTFVPGEQPDSTYPVSYVRTPTGIVREFAPKDTSRGSIFVDNQLIGPDMEDGSMVSVTATTVDEAQAAIDATRGFSATDNHHAPGKEVELYAGPAESPVRELVTSDSYKNAHDVYNAADQALAAKVGRRLKLGMFASKKTREAHSAEVEAQRVAYERMSEGFDAIQIEKWKLGNPTISEKELAGKLANYHEAKLRLQGLRSQHEIVTTHGKFGKLSEWSDKATEWYSRQSKVTKVGIAVGSVAVGALGGVLVATAGTVIGGAAGVVGGGMLAAAKVKKTHMQSRAGLYRNTIAVDKTRIENADGTYKSALKFQEESAAALKDSLSQRAEKADKINKKTRRMTIASAALLGAGIASHIDVVHDAYQTVSDHVGGWLDSFRDSVGTPHHVETGVTPSQGGGSGHNPVDKLGSGDVYHAPSIDTSIADAATAAHNEFMNSAANVIPAGGGGEAFMSAHGINPSVWYNNQAEFLAKFPGEAYQMPDGNVGFAKAGGLSKAAVAFWATKAGR